MSILTFTDVRKSYGAQEVLCGATFFVGPGRKVALVGPNGAGKSTIANLMLGLYRPDEGTVLADGVPYDADDVTLEALDGHGDGPGELARPDGQTELRLGTHLDGRPGFRSVVQNLIEQDCLPTEPIDVWRAKPGLERLLEQMEQ